MLIVDWSSDVCSSDLAQVEIAGAWPARRQGVVLGVAGLRVALLSADTVDCRAFGARRPDCFRQLGVLAGPAVVPGGARRWARLCVSGRSHCTEERRGGKEGVSKGRSRWRLDIS